jgi:hypothetical protein
MMIFPSAAYLRTNYVHSLMTEATSFEIKKNSFKQAFLFFCSYIVLFCFSSMFQGNLCVVVSLKCKVSQHNLKKQKRQRMMFKAKQRILNQ